MSVSVSVREQAGGTVWSTSRGEGVTLDGWRRVRRLDCNLTTYLRYYHSTVSPEVFRT